MKNSIALVLAFLLVLQINAQKTEKIKVACIGNSITYGAGIQDRVHNSYPAQLQKLLGDQYEVTNYGVSGTTLLKNGNLPYWNTPQYQAALASNPDIIFIKLGTNDCKYINRTKLDAFENDYHSLARSFAGQKNHPRIILLVPVPSFVTDTAQIWNPVLVTQIIPHIQNVAFNDNLEIINLYPLLINKPEFFPDKLHPNAQGATVIANRLYEQLTINSDTAYDIFKRIDIPKAISSFYGFQCADFKFNNRNCKIVKPKRAAAGHPWIWRARFWGHEPQTDIALLERGFHVVYCDVAELFGNKEAVKLWNDYYALLKKAGLSKKAALEGMSRGGTYVYNWAIANPRKVACVYADNPVLDLKSWPGSQQKSNGSKKEWETFKTDYGFQSDDEAMKFHDSPIDNVKKIVKGHYPMLHVCGDADEDVPMIANTTPFEQKVKALKGYITVIHKPGFKHHPHSLPNPTPIVDFILKAVYSRN